MAWREREAARALVLWTGLIVLGLCVAPGAHAQKSDPPAGAPNPNESADAESAEAAEEAEELEGSVLAREAYYANRRINPKDASFDVPAARLRALREREQQARESIVSLPNAGTVWTPIGPAPSTNGQTPQDFAQQSPVSGRVNAMVIDPVNGAVFVGAAQGGVWKSTDSGLTWLPKTDGLASQAAGAISLDPSNHNVVYYGTGEGNFSADSYAGVGIFKSTDNGETWTGPVGTAEFGSRSVASIAVDRTNANVVLAASASGVRGVGAVTPPGAAQRGVFKSTDGGSTWVKKTLTGASTQDVRGSQLLQDPLAATRWYFATAATVATAGGLFLSTDNGETWAQVSGGGFPALTVPAAFGINRYVISAGVAPAAVQSTLYVGTGDGNAAPASRGGRIYKSTDSGATWTQLAAAVDYCMGQCFYDLPVWTVPNDPTIVYHGGAGAVATGGTTKANMRKSTDGGTTFVDIMRSADLTTAVHSDTHVVLTDPANANVLWTGNDGGVWRSTDAGVNWQDRNTTLQTMQFTGFDVLLSDPGNRAYGGTQDNGTMGWTGSGVSWPHLDFGDGGYAQQDQGNSNNLVHTYFNQTNNLIAVGCTTGGFAVTQGAYNASQAPGNGIALTDRVAFYAPIHLDHGSGAATSTLYFGTHRIWRASNFFATGCTTGASVFTSLSGATDLLGGAGFFTAIETQPSTTPGNNADVICGGSSTGRLFCTANATAGTPTWTERDTALATKLYIGSIVIDPTVTWNPGTSGTIYVARSGFYGVASNDHVRKSTDGGVTWSSGGTGIPDIPVNAIARDALIANRVWAGTDTGVYVSNNAGASWAPYGTGLPNAAVFDLKTSPLPVGQGAILLVTHGRGAYRLSPLTPVELQGFRVE